MTIRFHRGDLPAEYRPGPAIAVDTETPGLNPHRDRLCGGQISRGDGGGRGGAGLQQPPPRRRRPASAVRAAALGPNPHRDRLCVVQISRGDGDADVVQILKDGSPPDNLIRALSDESVLKIFHYARFDLAVLFHAFGVMPRPVYCTKIASRLVRTYNDRDRLEDLLRELLAGEGGR